MKKLYRSNTDKVFAGVLGGVGEYFDIDPTLVRFGYIILAILTAFVPAIIGYVIAFIIIPDRPSTKTTDASYTETPKTETKKEEPPKTDSETK